jgi:uncharacterized Zn finger protein
MSHSHTARGGRSGHNNLSAYPLEESSVTHATLERLAFALRSKPVPTLGEVLAELLNRAMCQRAVEVYGAAATRPARAGIKRLTQAMAQKALADWETTVRMFYDGQGVEDFVADVQATTTGDSRHD